jgi:predicted transcriptional regulator
VARRKGTELSVFKGREAKLNHAIFQALALKGPQTIYDLHKKIRTQRGLKYTKYASVNKRVRSLEESGYIEKADIKKTKAGFEAMIYEATFRAYLAILLNSLNLEVLVTQADEGATSTILAAVIHNLQQTGYV